MSWQCILRTFDVQCRRCVTLQTASAELRRRWTACFVCLCRHVVHDRSETLCHLPPQVPRDRLHLAATLDGFAWSVCAAFGSAAGGIAVSKLGAPNCKAVLEIQSVVREQLATWDTFFCAESLLHAACSRTELQLHGRSVYLHQPGAGNCRREEAQLMCPRRRRPVFPFAALEA